MRLLHTLAPSAGFDAALAALGVGPEWCARGSSNLLASADRRLRAWKGLAVQGGVEGGTVLFAASDGYASLGSVGSPGGGSVAAHINDSLWFAGAGPLRYNGLAVGALSASSTLQFVLRSGSSYLTTAYQAGRVAPSPAAVTARDNVGGTMNGQIAMRFTRINGVTGGESDASDFTLPISFTAGKAVVSFDGISLDSNGQDAWGFFGTRVGFQTEGPAYRLVKYPEVADSSLATLYGIPRAVEIQFTEGELDFEDEAPIDNDPPPACSFVAALENFVLVFNVFGNGVLSSKPGYPEAFPVPDNLTFLPERAVAVYPRPLDDFVLVACRGSLHAVVSTGAFSPPFAVQTVLPELGVAAHHNVCFVEDSIYLFTNQRGICRVRRAGEPDYAFAERQQEYTAAWNPADVVVGYDLPTQQVVFCHGSEMLPFNRQTGQWGAPLSISTLRGGGFVVPLAGAIRGAVTVAGKLYLDIVVGGVHVLYRFSEGGGGSRAVYQSPWMPAAAAQETVRRLKLHLEGTFNRAATLKIFRNGDLSAAYQTFNVPAQAGGARLRHLRTLKPNVRNAESYCVQLTIDSDDGTEALIAAQTFAAPSGVLL